MSTAEVDPLVEYRARLVLLEQKAQANYDKSVLTLSGGALGVSFAFIKDIAPAGALAHPLALVLSWCAWALSVLCVLFSYFTSQRALSAAIAHVDTVMASSSAKTLHQARLGGAFDRFTGWLNGAGGVLFLFGVVSMIVFVVHQTF